MEVYILDSLWRREHIVDRFESFIWTERFQTMGDFELKLHSTLENRNLFSPGVQLAMNESHRIMQVETVEDHTDEEGRSILSVKGRSLEKILDSRLARGSTADLTVMPKWILTGKPVDIAKQIFRDVCLNGVISTRDILLGITEGRGMYAEDTIPEPQDEITYEMDPMTVYSAIVQLCELYDFGFRLVRDYDTSQLYFDVYMGSDRTSGQSVLPAVVFSPNLNNLKNTSELTTTAIYRNVAMVISPVGTVLAYPDDVDPDLVTGWDREVLWVKADDITDTDPLLAQVKMIQRGKEELTKHRRFSVFDGEISQRSEYLYGRDYNLGDLVDLQNVDGVMNVMQVVEQIFVSDKEGERSYPTLAINKFITLGSWSAWDYNQVWEDMGLTEYWENQP